MAWHAGKRQLLIQSILLSILLLGLLSGCSGESDGSPPPTEHDRLPSDTSVTFSIFGADPRAQWQHMQDDVGSEITARTGVSLKAEWGGGDFSQRIAQMTISGEYPDLISPKGDLSKLVDAGAMLDLTELIEQHAPNIDRKSVV